MHVFSEQASKALFTIDNITQIIMSDLLAQTWKRGRISGQLYVNLVADAEESGEEEE